MTTQTLSKVPMRFRKGDARVLKARVQWLIANGITEGDGITMLNQAAQAAESGEPLMVWCRTIDEVKAMADDFIRFGIRRPAIG